MTLRELAPGKVNAWLFLGPMRYDGRHELVTVLESVSLADELTLVTGPTVDHDHVVCPGIEGPNLVAAALGALRVHGWSAPPVRIEIEKRIPVAGGMAGGSADAAAALRLAARLAPFRLTLAAEIAAALGSDVPSQLQPGLALGIGAGDRVEPLPPLPTHAFVIVPLPYALSARSVYAEADRLGLGREPAELERLQKGIRDGERPAPQNDLEAAACSLCPAIEEVLGALGRAGAEHSIVSGSGPTCAGIWWGERAEQQASDASRSLAARFPGAQAAVPVADIGHNFTQT